MSKRILSIILVLAVLAASLAMLSSCSEKKSVFTVKSLVSATNRKLNGDTLYLPDITFYGFIGSTEYSIAPKQAFSGYTIVKFSGEYASSDQVLSYLTFTLRDDETGEEFELTIRAGDTFEVTNEVIPVFIIKAGDRK